MTQPISHYNAIQRLPLSGHAGVSGLVVSALALGGCTTSETPNMLAPQGPAAAEIAELWWFLFWGGLAVFLVVLALCLIAVLKSHSREEGDPEPMAARPAFVVSAGGVIPALILVGVLMAAVRTSNVLFERSDDTGLTIEVIGRQWWWEVRYPDYGIVTANEIYMPVGEPVTFKVTSRDVIHSFWVPQLAGKIDVIDGTIYTTQLEAWEPGEYRGICAEFCGVQHSYMGFLVVAQTADEFAVWLEQQQASHVSPRDEQEIAGRAIYIEQRCDQCHMVRGQDEPAPPAGRAGPDLTHLGSRFTLAGATLENNPDNLARLILDPHELKPGVHMPPTPLDEEEIQALVAYLLAQD